MRDELRPVTEKFTRDIGEDVVKQFYAEIEKVRGTQLASVK